ncbi:mate-domain-containing protein [Radiomyces spectabilis]|uniref:mate-domain-containing protein n=1 Tax=Radiomyces spectabilis TaxID=64574 RepID=UPI00221F9CCB|nr:mate-domain-containing protein [Radiomyces spectabilis]KAI8377930.1 mate-domain-containing protein [Radiomyces spectabilis]
MGLSQHRHTKYTDDDTSSNSSVSLTLTEQSPLLSYKSTENASYKEEFQWMLVNSLPIIGTYLLQSSFQMASIFTLGHLGPLELGASALGSMFATVSAWSITYGTSTALDTLCSQAWTGARDKTLLGIHLQRALLVLAILFIPISITWWNATRLLIFVNQDPDLAALAGLFLRYLLIGAPAYISFEAIKKFCQAQGIMEASTYALFVTSPINLGLNYLFVYCRPFQLGFIGAPLATSCSYWLMLCFLLIYIYYCRGYEAWGGWTRECLRDWWPFLRLAIPGILMVCTEWWAFELAALAASYLGTIDLAAQSILLTLVSATYTIPFGIAVAAANRVGNALGEGHGQKAYRASIVTLLYAVIFGALNSLFFIVGRTWLGYLFTSDKPVIDAVANILPLLSLFQIADGLCGVCGGVIRGLGRQNIAACINLFAYYLVALPAGFLLTFRATWGLQGIWSSLSLALFLAAIGECGFLFHIDWHREAKNTRQRIRKEEQFYVHTESDPDTDSTVEV